MAGVSAWAAARLALQRDLTLAFRRPAQLLQPLAFFALVTMLFPLAISPELSQLRLVAPGAIWAAALLASLLALEFLFRDDAQDGTLEQYALSGTVAHGAAVRQDRRTLAAHGTAARVMAPVAALSLGAPASLPERHRGRGRAGERDAEPGRLHRRRAHPGHQEEQRPAVAADPAAVAPRADIRGPCHAGRDCAAARCSHRWNCWPRWPCSA